MKYSPVSGKVFETVLSRTIDQDIQNDHVKKNEEGREADITEKGGFGKRIELLDGGFHFVVSLESWIIRDKIISDSQKDKYRAG